MTRGRAPFHLACMSWAPLASCCGPSVRASFRRSCQPWMPSSDADSGSVNGCGSKCRSWPEKAEIAQVVRQAHVGSISHDDRDGHGATVCDMVPRTSTKPRVHAGAGVPWRRPSSHACGPASSGTSCVSGQKGRVIYGSYVDELLLMRAAGERHYYASNRQYSPVAITTQSGQVAERYMYTAYGDRVILADNGVVAYKPSDFGQFIGFTGRYHDYETQLTFFRTRVQDPKVGRFLNRNPWFGMGSLRMGNMEIQCLDEEWSSEFDGLLGQSRGSYIQDRYNLYDFMGQDPSNSLEPFSGRRSLTQQQIVELEAKITRILQALGYETGNVRNQNRYRRGPRGEEILDFSPMTVEGMRALRAAQQAYEDMTGIRLKSASCWPNINNLTGAQRRELELKMQRANHEEIFRLQSEIRYQRLQNTAGSRSDYGPAFANGQNGIYGTINANGRVDYYINAVASPVPGHQMFSSMMNHFGSNVSSVGGTWTYGTNLQAFNAMTASGISPQRAAMQTWAGEQAASFGFSNATSIKTFPAHATPGNYTKVEVTYGR